MNFSVCEVTCLHGSLVPFSLSHISANGCIAVGFQILTAVVMKSLIFWDIMPCGLVEVNQHIVSDFMVEE
jgi:hypothetical protein